MHAALAEYLGRPVDWHHCAVHRWRYALPQAQSVAPAESFWWDAAQSLGVCGDFLGGAGVEGAWLSADSVVAALLRRAAVVADASSAVAAHEVAHPTARRLVA
jgi:predicted NAD/FAD-dependent oxidoreductase